MADKVQDMQPPEKNFWLWGTWGKRKITAPFLTQKVGGKIRDVVIGQSFIIAVQEDGRLVAWGEDKSGCLGLGSDKTTLPDPEWINFSEGDQVKVIDIQFGRRHLMALTDQGKVYTWGENGGGQLGLGDFQGRFEPFLVEDLKEYSIKQILAVDNMSYALDAHGVVHAWGDNAGGALGLSHDTPKVPRPEPVILFRSEGTEVKKLMVKESSQGGKVSKVILACIGMVDQLPDKEMFGSFTRPFGEIDQKLPDHSLSRAKEKEIIEGVDLMRKILDNLLEDWRKVVEMRHGSPYDDQGFAYEKSPQADIDNCTPEQLDRLVDLDALSEAERNLKSIIEASKLQMQEVRGREKGTRNIQCVLSVFIDMCRLRREKIKCTITTRKLTEFKRDIEGTIQATDLNSASEAKRLQDANERLRTNLDRITKVEVLDVFGKVLRKTIEECIECKLEVHATQLEHMKAVRLEPANLTEPALQIVKERWVALRNTSVYKLYSDLMKSPQKNFRSDEEMLTFLCQKSDAELDAIIHQDRDRLISRDLLVPPLCYDLLVENAELRKMSNAYQLRVLIMRQAQKDKM